MPTIRILLVEDEPMIRELLVDVLTDAGFEIVEADTGDTAFDLLERNNLQLLLTDINMPGRIDGIELARLARVAHPAMPVIFITGRPDGAICAANVDMPCTVMRKPFKIDDMLTNVRELAGSF